MDNLVIRSRADSPNLKRAARAIEQAAWNQLGYLNYTRSHYQFYDELMEEYPEYQLCLVDPETDYPVAVSSCVPLLCSSPDDLPAEGWDWMVETAAASRGLTPNYLGALAVSVPVIHRGKGYARRMIGALRQLAESKGLKGPLVAVRPSAKAKHPHVPIGDYIEWTDGQGRLYDPWLRSHVAAGGRIVRPCERSMVVEEPIPFWEAWVGERLGRSGDYTIEGGLVPVAIDVERQMGRYEEPNVWVTYSS
jgi:GNAT superfamily N-acetyltransferase